MKPAAPSPSAEARSPRRQRSAVGHFAEGNLRESASFCETRATMNANVRALLLMAGCLASGLSMMSCKEEEAEEFGFTCVELSRGESVDVDPFEGTYKIVLKLDYLPCLKDYYLNKHPEQRLDGKEGPAVFAEWKERLCSEAVARRIDCEVESFDQTLMTTGTESYSLAVTYITPNPGDLVGRKILWGPGPLPDYAECDTGDLPFAALTRQSGITGQNKAGKILWQAQSFTDNKGVMQLSGGGCIQAPIAPVN